MLCNINETYPCIVGESLASGLPAYLVRFSKCNLHCSYCDSQYAWFEPGSEFDTADLVREIVDSGLGRALLTGGEPMLQSDAIRELAEALHEHEIEVLLETNGTIPLDSVPRFVMKIVDVKTPGAEASRQFHLLNLQQLGARDQLKFVVTSREDFDWVHDFLDTNLVALPASSILVSPAWGTVLPETLAAWMLERPSPYRFHLQLHKVLFGEKRGV